MCRASDRNVNISPYHIHIVLFFFSPPEMFLECINIHLSWGKVAFFPVDSYSGCREKQGSSLISRVLFAYLEDCQSLTDSRDILPSPMTDNNSAKFAHCYWKSLIPGLIIVLFSKRLREMPLSSHCTISSVMR